MKKLLSVILVLVMVSACIVAAHAEETESVQYGITGEHFYWNSTVGIGCVLDDEWYFLERDQILELLGYTKDMLNEELVNTIEESGSFIDMYAVNSKTGDTLNVTMEKLPKAQSILINEKQYVEISVDTMMQTMEHMGVTNVEYEIGKAEFAGEEHPYFMIWGNLGDSTIYEKMAVTKVGDTMVLVTVASQDGVNAMKVLDTFSTNPDIEG